MKHPRVMPYLVLPDEIVFEIIDMHTVRFTFPKPDGIALSKFLWFLQIAPEFFSKFKFAEFNWGILPETGPWGTGPFKFVQGTIGSHFDRPSDALWVFEAYEEYWDRRYPKVQRVLLDNALDRHEAMRLCREKEGRVDIINFIRPLDTLKVAESPFAKVMKERNASLLAGWFNQLKKESRWRDSRLRRAVNYAINREELLKYCAKGNAYNLGGYIPQGGFGHNPNLPLYNYDITKARSLLAEAGYPNGFEVKIVAGEAWKLEGQIIAKMLERIGLNAKLDVLPQPQLMKRIYHPYLAEPPEEQDWDIAFYYWEDWYGHTGTTFLTFGLLEDSNLRWVTYDSIYEENWKSMARINDREAQEERIRELAHYVYERAYLLFIYSPLMLYAVNKAVDFVPQGYPHLRLKETSVTDNHWSLRD